MLEVLFGESEAASMRFAKSSMFAGQADEPTAAAGAGRETPLQSGPAGERSGTAKEVSCLAFGLDVGDIREPLDGPYRQKLIYAMRAGDHALARKYPEIDAEWRRAGEVCAGELRRLKSHLEKGEPIRIWYSEAPYSICGFYCLCRILQDYHSEVHVVKLPAYARRETGIVSYSRWGEVAPEELSGFTSRERVLSREEVRMYALLWTELEEDNSPLRAVINGRVIGVQEDFYDFLIWRGLKAGKPVREVRLIGDLLGLFPLGVDDWWFAQRIQHLTKQGRIWVLEDSENEYLRVICAADSQTDAQKNSQTG